MESLLYRGSLLLYVNPKTGSKQEIALTDQSPEPPYKWKLWKARRVNGARGYFQTHKGLFTIGGVYDTRTTRKRSSYRLDYATA